MAAEAAGPDFGEVFMLTIFKPTHFVAAALLFALSSTAWADDYKWKPFGETAGWKVGSLSIDGGYMRCSANLSSTTSSFQKSSEGVDVVVATKLTGDTIKGSIAIDGKTSAGEFFRMENNRVGLFLKPAQLKALSSAKTLVVKLGTESTSIPLANFGTVLKMLTACDAKGDS